jgi:ribonuclease-3
MRRIEKAAGHRFRRPELAGRALRHSSFANEKGMPATESYERLELLGDAVLDFLVVEAAYHAHPEWREGEISKLRGTLAGEAHLAQVSARMGLGKLIEMGAQERPGEEVVHPSILADVFESLLAAVYLDGGLGAARRLVERELGHGIRSATRRSLDDRNFKSRLQEVLQSLGLKHPRYQRAGETGPPHRRVFRIRVALGGKHYDGDGHSMQAAEQACAENALEHIEEWIHRLNA